MAPRNLGRLAILLNSSVGDGSYVSMPSRTMDALKTAVNSTPSATARSGTADAMACGPSVLTSASSGEERLLPSDGAIIARPSGDKLLAPVVAFRSSARCSRGTASRPSELRAFSAEVGADPYAFVQ